MCRGGAGCGVGGDGGRGSAEVGAGAGGVCAGVRGDVLADGAAGAVAWQGAQAVGAACVSG
ncbi:MAG: hypothetical protein UDG94_00705 [Peptococcaceae bacterium]|nr:hypothetical protein [Peptococcaceae bacterium]